jgi:hypothetical protein
MKSLLMITKSTQPNWLPSTVSFLKLGSRFWLTAVDSRKWPDVYSQRTLLTRSWLYESVTLGVNPQPLYQASGYVKDNVHVKGQLFAVEETPVSTNDIP